MEDLNLTEISIEKLLDSHAFVQFAKATTEKEWQSFIKKYPNSRYQFEAAKEIVSAFQTRKINLDTTRKKALLDELNIQMTCSSKRKRNIRHYIAVACSFLLLILCGYYFLDSNKEYNFSQQQTTEKNEYSKLLLPNGEAVSLKQKEATIEIHKKGKTISILNDTIIENNERRSLEEKLTEVIVPFGRKINLTLSDGTKVWLNAGSRFAFPQTFAKSNRKVYLDGEAYFEVKKDYNAPFIVASDKIDIKVLGTKFNIHAYSTDLFSETVLLEGKVEAKTRNKLINNKHILQPGQLLSYRNKQTTLTKLKEPQLRITWIKGWHNLVNAQLNEVIPLLERHYNVKLKYNESVIKSSRLISGKLNLESTIEESMQMISAVANINYTINGNNIILTQKPMNKTN